MAKITKVKVVIFGQDVPKMAIVLVLEETSSRGEGIFAAGLFPRLWQSAATACAAWWAKAVLRLAGLRLSGLAGWLTGAL